MPVDFKMKKKGDYLLVTCQGAYDGTGLKDVHQKALDCAVKEDLRAILVDTTGLHGHAPTAMERFDFGAAIADMQRRNRSAIWIAFVGKEPLVDPGRFGETVAVNRGGFAKVFEDVDEAAAWINERLAVRDNAKELSRT
jgi:hypothetical protein